MIRRIALAILAAVALASVWPVSAQVVPGSPFQGGSSSGTSLPVSDATSIVMGSSDATKLLRFEVDGFTTGTTRVITFSNADQTVAGVGLNNTFSANNTFSGQVLVTGKLALQTRQSATVDGATTFALTQGYVVLACTGAETINTITGGITGMVVYLENSDSECTLADDDDATAANAIDLTGTATTDVGAVAKVLTLIYNGSHWLQTGESDN